MSLYRTWRPRTFAELVGQDAVVRTLTTALSTSRLAHAYLFSGPRGSGKTSAAKILARCIECEAGPTATPDNTCAACTAILNGTALDVLEIDAASNRGIDEIRALRDAVKFPPSSMRMKVYIIDEAHMLTKEGANAFLKTLEEPPPYAVFVLATTAPEALPPTILSRCQRYAFRRIPIVTMIERMRVISDAEGIEIDDAALGAIAYRADGGLRDALTMLEQVAAFAAGPVDAATVDAAFGHAGREFARRVQQAALGGDAAAALAAIDDASEAGTEIAGLIRATIAEFRHLLVARIEPDLLARDLSRDDAADAVERARVTPQPRLVRGLRLLSDALSAARGSGNARLELETAVLRFILQTEDPSLDALAARVAALEAGEAAAPVVRPAPGAPAGRRAAPPADRAASVELPPATGGAPAAARAPEPAPPVASERRKPAPGLGGALRPAGPRTLRAVESPPSPSASADEDDEFAGIASPTEPDDFGPPPAAAPTARAAGDGGELTLHRARSLWANIRTRAEAQKTTLRSSLSRTEISAADAGGITLSVGDPANAANLKANLEVVRNAVAEIFGRPVAVHVVVVGRSAAAAGATADEPADLARYADDILPR